MLDLRQIWESGKSGKRTRKRLPGEKAEFREIRNPPIPHLPPKGPDQIHPSAEDLLAKAISRNKEQSREIAFLRSRLREISGILTPAQKREILSHHWPISEHSDSEIEALFKQFLEQKQ